MGADLHIQIKKKLDIWLGRLYYYAEDVSEFREESEMIFCEIERHIDKLIKKMASLAAYDPKGIDDLEAIQEEVEVSIQEFSETLLQLARKDMIIKFIEQHPKDIELKVNA